MKTPACGRTSHDGDCECHVDGIVLDDENPRRRPSGPVVINRWHFRYAPGCGPGREIDPSAPPLPDPWIYIGRGTPLGNPHRVTANCPGEVALALYRRDLWAWMKQGRRDVLEALRSITAAHHLVCSCAPGPCHGDIVVRAWHWLQTPAGAMV